MSEPDPVELRSALARLLRPLVQLLVRAGITFPACVELLRELYVNVAEKEFLLSEKEQTDSRVSLLTGIHRKEVRRLRGAGAPVNAVPAALSLTSRILARWLGSSDFTDPRGLPRALPRAGAQDGPSFETLVTLETRDVRPRAILDEWIHRGLVAVDDQDRLVLAATALLPEAGGAQQLHYFGRNLHDHMAAAVANVLGASPRFFERSVHYDGLSQDFAMTLAARSRALAAEALAQANRDAQAGCDANEGSWRWNFGVYVYLATEGGGTSPRPGDPPTGKEKP